MYSVYRAASASGDLDGLIGDDDGRLIRVRTGRVRLRPRPRRRLVDRNKRRRVGERVGVRFVIVFDDGDDLGGHCDRLRHVPTIGSGRRGGREVRRRAQTVFAAVARRHCGRQFAQLLRWPGPPARQAARGHHLFQPGAQRVDLRLQFTQVIAGLVGDFASDVRLDVHLVLAAGGDLALELQLIHQPHVAALGLGDLGLRRKRVTPMAPSTAAHSAAMTATEARMESWSLQTIATLTRPAPGR